MRAEPQPGSAQHLVGRVLDDGEVDVARRVGNRLAQQQLAHRPAAQGRRTAPRMRIEREEARLAEQPGAAVLEREFIRLPAGAVLDRDVVDRAERAGHEGAAGGEEVAIIAVAGDQFIDDGAQHLFGQCLGDIGVEAWIDHRIFGDVVELLEQQHVGEEGAYAVFEAGRLDHPPRDRGQLGIVGEPAGLRRGEQGIVGRGVPQQEAQPRCARQIVEPHRARMGGIGFGAFDDEQEIGGDQHRTERELHAAIEGAGARRRGIGHGDDALLFGGGQRRRNR
jgi:hypothetical protein